MLASASNLGAPLSERNTLSVKDPKLEYPDWQRPIFDALIEHDSEKVPEKIRIPELGILTRLQNVDPISEGEWRALHNGLASLSMLIQRRKLQRKDSSQEKAS